MYEKAESAALPALSTFYNPNSFLFFPQPDFTYPSFWIAPIVRSYCSCTFSSASSYPTSSRPLRISVSSRLTSYNVWNPRFIQTPFSVWAPRNASSASCVSIPSLIIWKLLSSRNRRANFSTNASLSQTSDQILIISTHLLITFLYIHNIYHPFWRFRKCTWLTLLNSPWNYEKHALRKSTEKVSGTICRIPRKCEESHALGMALFPFRFLCIFTAKFHFFHLLL